ncbi:putative protein kinase superfamily protein isoform X1 [Zea mays]|nr:putative protein kinase superfamily protein isoform X1 [Zea mays]|eukprot:XP_008676526.1 putative protein kinase superfamily protein isoform X1 [Zea mays]
MERILRCFNLGPTGSEDDDISFTLTVETFSFEELSAATDNFSSTLRIGSGGQATVYEGHIPHIGQVAVKRLRTNDFPSKQRAFLMEVYVLNSTNHPHIVKLLGCCSEGTERLLVYEYVKGGTLRHRLKELNWYTRMRIARDTATVLEKLHLQSDPPIIHRDFKSDNILLSTNLSPKVSDFGIAKIAPAGDELTAATSETLGTYGYASPGIFRPLNATVMTDIYSFGVVLLEIITGKPAIDHSKEGDEHYLVHWRQVFFGADYVIKEQVLE